MNARFTVHQYGLAHLLLVAASVLRRGRRAQRHALAHDRRRGRRCSCCCHCCWRPRRAGPSWRSPWPPPPSRRIGRGWPGRFRRWRRLGLYVLLVRGTISRGVEPDWLNQRLSYWTGTLSLLGDVPFTGAGLGMRTFAEVFAWYHALPDPYQVSHSHNVVVQAYAEQGILGAVGLAGLLVVGTLTALRATRRTHGPVRWLVAGAAGGFLGSALYGMTDQVPTNNLQPGAHAGTARDRRCRRPHLTPSPELGPQGPWGGGAAPGRPPWQGTG